MKTRTWVAARASMEEEDELHLASWLARNSEKAELTSRQE